MSNECTRDQYPFNGQMRTGTGPALVIPNRRGGREGGRREGGEGGREGGNEGGRMGREGGREGGRGGREGREGGRDDYYTYSNRFNFFLYRNILFMNSNMMHMLPTVHIIK